MSVMSLRARAALSALLALSIGLAAPLVVPAEAASPSPTEWADPVRIADAGQSPIPGYQSTADAAVSADGIRMVTVWNYQGADGYLVRARTTADGGATWTAPQDLASTGEYGPQVVMSADGQRLTVVMAGITDEVTARFSTDGGKTWSLPAAVIATSPGTIRDLRIAASADGRRVAAMWTTVTPSQITTAVSQDGGATWSGPTVLATGVDDFDLAASADGSRFAVVYDGSAPRTLASRVSSDGGRTWAGAQDLSAPQHTGVFNPAALRPVVALSADGNRVVAAWRITAPDGSGSLEQTQVRSSGDGGATWGPVGVLSSTGVLTQIPPAPAVAVSADGTRVTVAYRLVLAATPPTGPDTGGTVTESVIRASSSVDGGATWGEAPVSDPARATDVPSAPDAVASTDGGRVTVTWSTAGTGNDRVVAARTSADAGVTWVEPVRTLSPGQNTGSVVPAASSDGRRVIVVWRRDNPTPIEIQAAVTKVPGPLEFTPSPADFARVTVGTSRPVTVTVHNRGNAGLVPSAITAAGANVAVTGGTCVTGVKIPAGKNCTVTLTWAPAAAGALTGASLTIAYPDGSATSNAVGLTGTAVLAPVPHLAYPAGVGRVGDPMTPLVPHHDGLADPIRYAVTKGTLPDGLTLTRKTGVISGTPTKAGVTTVTITATDGKGRTATAKVTITINQRPAAPHLDYPAGVGRVSEPLVPLVPHHDGLTDPIRYAVTKGSLPSGLSLSRTTGVISGTPTRSGTTTITVTATGDTGRTATTKVTITIDGPNVVPHLDYPTGVGQVGVALSPLTPHTQGLSTPIRYAVTAGALPAGVSLDPATGVISGTPAAVASATVTVTATGSPGRTAAAQVSITVNDQPVAPHVDYPTGVGRIGVALVPLAPHTAGLSGTLMYAVTGGAFPPGVSLDSVTGLISGTPTRPGAFSATVTVTGTEGSASAQVAITVHRAAAQRPVRPSYGPPAVLAVPGTTVVTPTGAVTNAGQDIRTRVTCLPTRAVRAGLSPAGLSPVGDASVACRVDRGPGTRVTVTTTVRDVRVVVIQTAPATGAYAPYRQRVVYLHGTRT